MKVDFSKLILDLNGKPDKDKTTLGNLACVALTAMTQEEQANLSAEDKVKRFQLAMTVTKGKTQDITPEEFTMLKGIIGKLFGPLAVGRAYEILDAAAK